MLVAIGPALHLSSYIFSWMMTPLKFLAKFEVQTPFPSALLNVPANTLQTIYIYLGVAALIGLITGSILHLSSAVLVSLFNLSPTHEEREPKAPSHSPEHENLEKSWQNSLSKGRQQTLLPDDSLERKYAEWLEKSRGKSNEDQSLLGQTILEEEDDFENGF